MASTDAEAAAIRAFKRSGGILRTKDALAHGVHPRTLYRLRDEGVVEALSRGVYRLTELPDLAHPDLVAVGLRIPKAVVCLLSALAHHDATNEIPHEVHIALPRHTRTPRLDHPPIRVYTFSGKALTTGVDKVEVDGVNVRVYSLAKTVADCFKFRNELGVDVAVDALREAVRRHRIPPSKILQYARVCRVEQVMLPYLQALQ